MAHLKWILALSLFLAAQPLGAMAEDRQSVSKSEQTKQQPNEGKWNYEEWRAKRDKALAIMGGEDAFYEIMEYSFTPRNYPFDRWEGAIRIQYKADDYGYPIWSMLLESGCTFETLDQNQRLSGEEYERFSEDCRKNWIVWAVILPGFYGSPRPRAEWHEFRDQLDKIYLAPNPPKNLPAALDEANLQWVMTDAKSCPVLMDYLEKLSELEWVPANIPPASGKDMDFVLLHADRITIELNGWERRVEYTGWIEPQSPAAWAKSLVYALHPCWKPASVPPPWQVMPDDEQERQ